MPATKGTKHTKKEKQIRACVLPSHCELCVKQQKYKL